MPGHFKKGAEGVVPPSKITFNKKFACFGDFLFRIRFTWE